MSEKPALIIPVESQVRELDAKLLLACCAAERGYRVIIGSRAYVHFAMASLPRGIYLAKSMRGISGLMFRIICELGHAIVAWEEEALVHPPPDIFYSLRLSPETIARVSHLFAWGEENRELMLGYPHFPPGLKSHVTGNPRGDMLRPELRAFFDREVRALREEFGEFVMINTNFTDVNPYLPGIGLFVPSSRPGQPERLGQAGKGMPRPFAEGLRRHKQAILDDFLCMIPALERALPGINLVLRPHPSEDHAVYHRLAERCSRVHVTHRGNVVPWLLACRALVHNGCTTAVESYALGVPAVAYLETFNRAYDYDFQGLPNRLSRECFTLEELTAAVRAAIDRNPLLPGDTKRDALIDHYIAAREGRLASERVLDVLEQAYPEPGALPKASALLRARAALLARAKAALTRLIMNRPGRNRRAYHDHRFPPLSIDDVSQRIGRLGDALDRFEAARATRCGAHMFEITAENVA